MSFPVANKKKKEQDATYSDLDFNEAVQNLKVTPLDGGKYRIKGASGYETVFAKKGLKEGTYLVSICDAAKDSKKTNPKACFRFGFYCQTEEEEKSLRGQVYSLGSCTKTVGLRSSDEKLICGGEAVNEALPREAVGRPSVGPKKLFNELVDDYYMLVCLESPKNPQLIKFYKEKLPEEDLLFNRDAFVSFFRGGTHLATVKHLREGVYNVGVSLYMEAQVTLNLEPNVELFLKSVAEEEACAQQDMEQEALQVPLSASFNTCSVCCLSQTAPYNLRDLKFSPTIDPADS